MTEQERLAAALEYQQAQQAALMNPNLAAQGLNIRYKNELRKPFASEMQYFQNNPEVAGMAAEDDKVTLNPFSKISPQSKEAVFHNESSRIYMRNNLRPAFDLTNEQMQTLKNTPYGSVGQEQNAKETIAARIFSGDPSAGKPTDQQLEFVDLLKKSMGRK